MVASTPNFYARERGLVLNGARSADIAAMTIMRAIPAGSNPGMKKAEIIRPRIPRMNMAPPRARMPIMA